MGKKPRVPGTFGKQVRPGLEERHMNRGAGAALAQLRLEEKQRADEGRPMSKLEVFEREQLIVQRAQELYTARVTGFDGELT